MKEKLQENKNLLIYIVLILASIISFETYNFFIATIFLIILLSILLYERIIINKKIDKSNSLISKIKLNINDNISDMSYPIALIQGNGEVVWGNKRFKEELSNSNIEKQSILSIARNLDLQKLLKCDKDLKQRVKIKEGFYSVYANKIKDNVDSNYNLYIVYFIEVSNLRDLYATKDSVVLIEVDNLAEALERTEESNRPMLVAEVEKAINAYSQKLKAMIVKYESN